MKEGSVLPWGWGETENGRGREEREKERVGGEGRRKKMGNGGADSVCVGERQGGRFKRFRIRKRLLDLEDPGDLPSREGGEGHPG